MPQDPHIMPEIVTVQPYSVPVITMLCRTARIGQIVNHMVEWNDTNSKISPGLLIESLIICIICGRKPLWRVQQFWAQQDLRLLFADVDISLDQLNDDAYGRALDKLSEVKMEELVNLCSLVMLQAHDLNISTIHLDTTSKYVQGVYENEAHGDFCITYGYSKDRRPDLKQFKIGAAVQQNGQLVMGQMLSGNKSDKVWNPEAVTKMKKFFDNKGFKDVVFVSDCAIVSIDSLRQMAKKHIQFISRLPETFSLAQELKELAWQADKWNDIGVLNKTRSKKAARYKTFSIRHKLDGRYYDFVVVRSSSLDGRKEKSLKKRVAKWKKDLEKQARELVTQHFVCEPDALAALEKFQSKAAKMGFEVQGKVKLDEKLSYPHKGRPRKGEQPTVTVSYQAECIIGDLKKDFYEHLRQKESTFVLIANVKDRQKYNDTFILEEYKNQNSIETKFRFLKNPVYLGPVYLENQNRINALGYVFILVLLIASYLEYRVRKSLKETGEALIDPGNKRNVRPSVKTIMENLSYIQVIIINGKRYFPKNCNQQALNIVRWAGYDPAEVYLKPLPWYVGKGK